LFKPEMQNVILLGMMGLHSGIACTGTGTCGSIIGSAFAIAYVVGVTPEDIARNPRLNVTPCIPIVEDIMDRFEETYGATDCMRLRYNRTQRAFDFLDPDAAMYEALFAFSESKKCGFFANCYECGTDQGMPSVGARWAAESICDLLNREPEERKKIPLHLQGYGMMELKPKIEKVAQLMKELGLGRPNEKISWREYRRLKLKGKKGVEENRPCGADAPDNKY
jgi:hypothetical protein